MQIIKRLFTLDGDDRLSPPPLSLSLALSRSFFPMRRRALYFSPLLFQRDVAFPVSATVS